MDLVVVKALWKVVKTMGDVVGRFLSYCLVSRNSRYLVDSCQSPIKI
jgi:hypothetical protein